MRRFWRDDPSFWPAVIASLLATAIWWVGGKVVSPLVDTVVATKWPGFAEWLHELGWLAFLITVSVVLARRLTARAVVGHVGGLVILSAEYGVEGGPSEDVTTRLRSLVRSGTLHQRVDNETMGCDPAKARRKRLRVVYRVGSGATQTVEVTEKQEIRLP